MSTGPYCHYYCLRCQHFSDFFFFFYFFFPYLAQYSNINKQISTIRKKDKPCTPNTTLLSAFIRGWYLSSSLQVQVPGAGARCQVCRRGGEGGHIRQHFAELSKQQKMPPLCPRPVTYTPTHPHHIRIKSWRIPYLKSAPGRPPQLLHQLVFQIDIENSRYSLSVFIK